MIYGCNLCPGLKWNSFDEMMVHTRDQHKLYTDFKSESEKVADLTQKLETMTRERDAANAESDSLQTEIGKLSVSFESQMKDVQTLQAEVERLKAAESILVDQHEADHKEVVGLHEEVERLKSRLTCEQCDSTKSIDGGSICFACWNRVCAEKQSALLQNGVMRKALEDIAKREGSGLDGSPENATGRKARLALDGKYETPCPTCGYSYWMGSCCTYCGFVENRVDVPECGNCGGDLVRKTEPTWICPKCEL